MNITPYEKTYVCVNKSLKTTEDLDKIVNILKQLDHPVSCKELGKLAYGDAYNRPKTEKDKSWTWDQVAQNSKACTLTARLTQMLSHLTEGGFVKVEQILSEPYTYETEEWIDVDIENRPDTIEVWDAQGNKYNMPNPNYTGYHHYQTVKVIKLGHKKINVYSWVKGA